MNIKALIILGSITGFLVGIACGMASDTPWPATIWHASLAALLAAWLTRWWTGIWLNGLQDAMRKRETEIQAEKNSANAKAPAKV